MTMCIMEFESGINERTDERGTSESNSINTGQCHMSSFSHTQVLVPRVHV